MISFNQIPKSQEIANPKVENPNGPSQSNYLNFLKQQKQALPDEQKNKKKRKFNDMSFLPKTMIDDLENSKSIKSNVDGVDDTSNKSDLYAKIVGIRRKQEQLDDKKSHASPKNDECSESS